MAVNLELFNRIINLKFIGENGKVVTVTCPKKGRKPNIELHATIWPSCNLPAFNLTVKNMYLDLREDVYTKVEVEAGYAGRTTTITGSVIMLYQEEPGPEGTTYIQCREGGLKEWLDAYINVEFKAGTYLAEVLAGITKNLSNKGTRIARIGNFASRLSLPSKFVHNGTAREAIQKLMQMFQGYCLAIYTQNDILNAVCLTYDDYIKIKTLKYISGPPQFNIADESGELFTTITAPWDPTLQVGDELIIPSRTYQNYGRIGGTVSGEQKIHVTQIEVHFGTCGGLNSMTVEGYV